MTPPLVSLCIPTYNRAWCLPKTLTSALSQRTSLPYEVVVMDDGSTDETPALVQGWGDPRLRYERNPVNAGYAGMSANWNRCLQAARGEYIALCGDDDWLAPEFLAEHAAVLAAHPEAGLVYCACQFADLDDVVFDEWWPFPRAHVWSSDQELEFLTRRHYLLSAPMLRRRQLDQVGQFNTALLFYWDWEFFLRFACRGAVGYVAQPLYVKRQHTRKLALAFDIGPGGAKVKAEGRQIVEQVLRQAPGLTPERVQQLNRRRYSEIAKGELFDALAGARRGEWAAAGRAFQAAWDWQFRRAGWRLAPQTLADSLAFLQKRRRGRLKYVFDIEAA